MLLLADLGLRLLFTASIKRNLSPVEIVVRSAVVDNIFDFVLRSSMHVFSIPDRLQTIVRHQS